MMLNKTSAILQGNLLYPWMRCQSPAALPVAYCIKEEGITKASTLKPKLYIYPKCYETSNNESCTSAILGPSLSWADWAVRAILKIKFLVLILFLYTPSPCVTRFHVAQNSTSAEFLKTALCGIPLQWNSSKSRYAEFQRNSKYSPTNAIFA